MERMVDHKPFNSRGKHMDDQIQAFAPLAVVWTTKAITSCYANWKPRKELKIPEFPTATRKNTMGQCMTTAARPIGDVKKIAQEFERMNGVKK